MHMALHYCISPQLLHARIYVPQVYANIAQTGKFTWVTTLVRTWHEIYLDYCAKLNEVPTYENLKFLFRIPSLKSQQIARVLIVLYRTLSHSLPFYLRPFFSGTVRGIKLKLISKILQRLSQSGIYYLRGYLLLTLKQCNTNNTLTLT